MPFKAGYIYPLFDADRFDDDYGEGYGFIAIPVDAEPGDCFIHDAWPVNEKGEVHPGYNECPIPVRLEDVQIEKGKPIGDAALPNRRSVFDVKWIIGS